MIKYILGFAMLCYGGFTAIQLGSIWDSRANPAAVKVDFPGGRVVEGSLMPNWDRKTWTLTSADGVETRFELSNIAMLTSKLPQVRPPGLLPRWRALLPIGLFALLALALLAFAVIDFTKLLVQWRKQKEGT